MMKIGEWVRQYRKEHGLSMQAFGDLCGLSRAYISILEKGINPTTNEPFSPTIQTVQKIADVTGLDLNLLDIEDRAEIRGEIKGMLKAAKYKSKIKSDEAI